jgi:hypothetical protein
MRERGMVYILIGKPPEMKASTGGEIHIERVLKKWVVNVDWIQLAHDGTHNARLL